MSNWGERQIGYAKWEETMWNVHLNTLKKNWHDFEEYERRKLLSDMVAHAPEVADE